MFGNSSKTNITKITMTQELSDLPKPQGTQGQANTFTTNIVGVTYKNDDNVSRQTLIKIYAKEGLTLDIDFYLYEGDVACGVYLDGNQLGNLSSDIAKELFNFIKKGGYIQTYIISSGEAEDTGKYGVTIYIKKVIQKEAKKTTKGKIQGDVICEDCGTIGTGATKVAGTFWVELLLYIIGIMLAAPTLLISLLVPLGYSIHRRTASTKVCKKCGGKVISIYAPRGEKLLKEMGFVEA